MEISATYKIIIVCFVVAILSVMLWLYRESIMANIYPDYAIEPFESHDVCAPNSPAPYIWPDSFGQ